ncbi:hypothetical protein MMC12_003922 [Toensbergia leucococca]|nr:hypothetical protein [Toensbergia leucococca]
MAYVDEEEKAVLALTSERKELALWNRPGVSSSQPPLQPLPMVIVVVSASAPGQGPIGQNAQSGQSAQSGQIAQMGEGLHPFYHPTPHHMASTEHHLPSAEEQLQMSAHSPASAADRTNGQIAQSGLSANRDPILTGSPSSPTSSCSTTCSENVPNGNSNGRRSPSLLPFHATSYGVRWATYAFGGGTIYIYVYVYIDTYMAHFEGEEREKREKRDPKALQEAEDVAHIIEIEKAVTFVNEAISDTPTKLRGYVKDMAPSFYEQEPERRKGEEALKSNTTPSMTTKTCYLPSRSLKIKMVRWYAGVGEVPYCNKDLTSEDDLEFDKNEGDKDEGDKDEGSECEFCGGDCAQRGCDLCGGDCVEKEFMEGQSPNSTNSSLLGRKYHLQNQTIPATPKEHTLLKSRPADAATTTIMRSSMSSSTVTLQSSPSSLLLLKSFHCKQSNNKQFLDGQIHIFFLALPTSASSPSMAFLARQLSRANCKREEMSITLESQDLVQSSSLRQAFNQLVADGENQHAIAKALFEPAAVFVSNITMPFVSLCCWKPYGVVWDGRMDGDLHPFGQYAHFVGGEDERINQEEQLKESLENHKEDGTDISEDESETMLSIPMQWT